MRALTLTVTAMIAMLAASNPTTAAPPASAATPVPSLDPPRAIRIPGATQKTLANGLRLVVLEDHAQPTVWIRLALPAGTVRDPDDRVGLASMTAALLNKGAAGRSAAQIATSVDDVGASLGATANSDYLIVTANALSAYAPRLMDLVGDVALRPTFPQAEIDRYRTRARSGIQATLAQPAALASAALNRLIYGAHPYGNFATGTPQTLARITRDDLKTFHDATFIPNGATLFLFGDITPSRALALAQKSLAGWAKGNIVAPPAPPTVAAGDASGKPHITILDRPGAAQTDIRIGALAPGYADPGRVPGNVAAAILGESQFNSRLAREIRVTRGLTYGVGAGFARNEEAGKFQVGTFTKNASTGQVVQIALDELRKLRENAPGAAELGQTKSLLIGGFDVSVAAPDELLQRLLSAVLYGSGPSELSRYVTDVSAVTPGAVKNVLGALPLGEAQVVLVGDAKAIQSQVAGLGSVTVIEPDQLDLLSPTLMKTDQTPTAPPPPATGGTPSAAPSGAAPAVPTTPATAEETAAGKALLAAAIKAHGGDVFLNVQSIKATGTGQLTPPGQPSAMPVDKLTLYAVTPDRARLDMETMFGLITLASAGAGKGGWLSIAGAVQDQPLAGSLGDPTAILRAASQKNYAARALPDGATPFLSDDKKTLKSFAVTDEAGKVTTLSVETDTNRLRRVESRQGPAAAMVLLGGYKESSGVQLPSRIVLHVNGQQVIGMTLATFEVNKPIDSKLFDRPAE